MADAWAAEDAGDADGVRAFEAEHERRRGRLVAALAAAIEVSRDLRWLDCHRCEDCHDGPTSDEPKYVAGYIATRVLDEAVAALRMSTTEDHDV